MLMCCRWGMNLRLPRSPTLPVMAIWTRVGWKSWPHRATQGNSGSEQQQLLSLLGRMAQLAPMSGASEAELEAAPMSLPILPQAMVFLLRASQSPPGLLSPCQQPASACTSRTRAERSQLSLQTSLSWHQQEVGLVCKGSLWSSDPLARGHHHTLQFLGCISFSTQKLGDSVGFLDTLRTRRAFCTERTRRVQVTPRELSQNSSASVSHFTNWCTEAPRGRRLATMTGAGQCSE